MKKRRLKTMEELAAPRYNAFVRGKKLGFDEGFKAGLEQGVREGITQAELLGETASQGEKRPAS